jgi:hypothetical protein
MIAKLNEHVRLMVLISNINTVKSIYYVYFHSLIKYGVIFGVTLYKMGRFPLCKRKLSELWLVYNPEHHVEVCLNNQRFYLFIANTLMNFSIINQENSQTNSSIPIINTRNKHHLHRPYSSLSCFQRSTFYASFKIFNSLPLSLKILNNDKEKFKAALRKYLIHTPFTLYMKFLCVKVIYNTVL